MGSIYQRTSDGRWCVAVMVAGKRIVRYAGSEREARRILAELERDSATGRLVAPTRLTLSAWVTDWLATSHYRPSTTSSYQQVLAPTLTQVGHVRLDRLTPALLHRVLATLAVGERRRQQAYAVLHRCLSQAVTLGILGTNPMDRVPKPAWRPHERRYWSPEEAGRFVATVLGEPRRWSPLFVLLTTCGLRIGEALGLQWRDLDLAGGTLRIERALVWSDAGCHLVPPKSQAGYRTITLPPQAVAALRCLPRSMSRESFVFHDGRPPRRSTLRQALIRECRRSGVPFVNVHGLRHVAAQVAILASGDLHAAARRLGHASAGITVRQYGYGHTADAEVAAALGLVFAQQEEVAR